MESIIGKKYGHWLVLSEADSIRRKDGKAIRRYNCRCDCGTEKVVFRKNLLNGRSGSCGCSKKGQIKDKDKHEFWKSRISHIYRAMINRCYNPKAINYKNYGGRGIIVCEEWLGEEGRMNFFRWAKENGYSDNLSLDRIDNSLGYSPSNCRWATCEEQGNNTRNSTSLTFNGITRTYTQWAKSLGISSGTIIKQRIESGWSIEEAVTTKRAKPFGIKKHKPIKTSSNEQ